MRVQKIRSPLTKKMINPPKEKQETVMMKHRENGMRVTLQRIQFQMPQYYYLFQDLITSHRFSGKIMICVRQHEKPATKLPLFNFMMQEERQQICGITVSSLPRKWKKYRNTLTVGKWPSSLIVKVESTPIQR